MPFAKTKSVPASEWFGCQLHVLGLFGVFLLIALPSTRFGKSVCRCHFAPPAEAETISQRMLRDGRFPTPPFSFMTAITRGRALSVALTLRFADALRVREFAMSFERLLCTLDLECTHVRERRLNIYQIERNLRRTYVREGRGQGWRGLVRRNSGRQSE